MEKNHKDDMSREDTIKLTVKSLLEVVQTGAKNIEISVMESYGKITVSSRDLLSYSLTSNGLIRRALIWPRSRRLSLRSNARRKRVSCLS